MGLPNTLAGNLGLIVFVIFVVGMAATDLYPDESKQIIESQAEFTSYLNATINTTSTTPEEGFWNSLSSVGNLIINFFSMLIAFLTMCINYELLFLGISVSISQQAPELLLLFALLQIGTIVSLIKLIFLSGD